jgi:POT family proton-dependent oligopeptide transporter
MLTFRIDSVKVVHGQNDLLPAAKVMKCAIQNGFNMERTKSSHQLLQRGKINPWTDSFVDEVSATLHTCRVL